MSLIKWIVVADDSGARVFKTLGRSPQLTCFQEFDHPQAHERASERGSDRPGRSFDSVGGARHAMGAEVDSHRQEERRFAHELAHYLTQAYDRRDFSELVLVAAPQFLGELRQALGDTLKEHIVETLDKDFPKKLDVHQVIAHLQEELFSLKSGME